MSNQEVPRSSVLTAPTLEPLTPDEAKRQCYVAASDTASDAEFIDLIRAAREQWEHDTDTAVMTQTVRMQLAGFEGDRIALLRRPVQSLVSVTYYDSSNVSQTLLTGYSLHALDRSIRLDFGATWPTTYDRWDAVTITYLAGYASRVSVPMIAKQAMLLLVNYYFDANRGDNDRPNDMRAYEKLVTRYMRSTYP